VILYLKWIKRQQQSWCVRLSPLKVLQLHFVSKQLQKLGECWRLLVVREQLLLRHLPDRWQVTHQTHNCQLQTTSVSTPCCMEAYVFIVLLRNTLKVTFSALLTIWHHFLRSYWDVWNRLWSEDPSTQVRSLTRYAVVLKKVSVNTASFPQISASTRIHWKRPKTL